MSGARKDLLRTHPDRLGTLAPTPEERKTYADVKAKFDALNAIKAAIDSQDPSDYARARVRWDALKNAFGFFRKSWK